MKHTENLKKQVDNTATKEAGDAITKDGMLLSDDELAQVSGGFREDNIELKGISYGMNITCPQCGEDRKAGFYNGVYVDTVMGSAEYRCRCGCTFVCYQNNFITLDDWITECNRHHYSYRNN